MVSETAEVKNREPFDELSAFQRDLLGIIAQEDGDYGLAIKGSIEALYGDDVNHGRLYPNLDTLVQKGYVEKSELDKRTNEYALTVEGRHSLRQFADWFGTCLGTDDQTGDNED